MLYFPSFYVMKNSKWLLTWYTKQDVSDPLAPPPPPHLFDFIESTCWLIRRLFSQSSNLVSVQCLTIILWPDPLTATHTLMDNSSQAFCKCPGSQTLRRFEKPGQILRHQLFWKAFFCLFFWHITSTRQRTLLTLHDFKLVCNPQHSQDNFVRA